MTVSLVCLSAAARGAERPRCEAAREEAVSVCAGAEVIVVGERHREAVGHLLFFDLVDALVSRGERLVVGLEIGSDRQPQLDAVIRGEAKADDVAVPPIDSPSYRELIRALGRLAGSSASRVAVRAIDAPADSGSDRDQEMAANVSAALRSDACDRVVVLVGNFHALKRVPNAEGVGEPRERLAGLLADRGVRVVSLLQEFPSACEGTADAAFHRADDEATSTMVYSLWRALVTDPSCPQPAPRSAVDGVVSWTCGE